MVQLESFIDPNRLEGFTYSENPVPVFTELKENYTRGYLSVPAIGAGTANTEFEDAHRHEPGLLWAGRISL